MFFELSFELLCKVKRLFYIKNFLIDDVYVIEWEVFVFIIIFEVVEFFDSFFVVG